MQSLLRTLLTLVIFALLSLPSGAQESEAQKSAMEILRSFSNGEFKGVWDGKVSKFLKDRVPEDVFLANMSMGRPSLGVLQDAKLVSSQHLKKDPVSGYEGDIYFLIFRTTYTTGQYFEHVAVVRDVDGEYRFSGIAGAPVPQQ
jgi:hypothetical protein